MAMKSLAETVLSEQQLSQLKIKIEQGFRSKRLHKGVAEVVKAVDQRRDIKQIYLVGELDPWYERAITSCLTQTKMDQKVNLIRLTPKFRRLVYDVIKDVNLKNEVRIKPRRFFLCRAFAI